VKLLLILQPRTFKDVRNRWWQNHYQLCRLSVLPCKIHNLKHPSIASFSQTNLLMLRLLTKEKNDKTICCTNHSFAEIVSSSQEDELLARAMCPRLNEGDKRPAPRSTPFFNGEAIMEETKKRPVPKLTPLLNG